MKQVWNKLVRDCIPEIIEQNGEKAVLQILSDEKYKEELKKKLLDLIGKKLKKLKKNVIKSAAVLIKKYF